MYTHVQLAFILSDIRPGAKHEPYMRESYEGHILNNKSNLRKKETYHEDIDH